MRFTRRRSGQVEATLDAVEARLLTRLATDLRDLLGDDAPEQDPLAALVGMPTGPVERPSDPALARLLPDAYGDDPAAADEFRRYTEADLRAGKKQCATTLLETVEPLVADGGRLSLDRDQADAWLGTLNDLRLVLGTRLQVTEDDDLDLDLDPDDPRAGAREVYDWLGYLQESLLSRLTPRTPG